MKFRIFPSKSIKLIIITILLLLFISMPAYAVLWSNKVDTEDLQRIITELRIYDDPDFSCYNEIFRLYYYDSKELLDALNKKIEITQQAMKILDADIKKEELGNLTYGRYILNAINEKELVEMGLKTGSSNQANGEYFSKLSGNLADWESQLSKFLLTKIIGATCTAIGAPALSIGISTLSLFTDLSIIGTSINKLNEVWYEKAFWSYIYFRNEPNNWDHLDAWESYAEIQVEYIINLSLLSLEKQKKAREVIEENFKSLWNKYEEYIVNNKLDEDFKTQQRESLKILLLYALGSESHPIITSPLKITPPPPYQVGDIINTEFTIANLGTLPIKFSVLTVGGRDPDNHVSDFTLKQNITLEPSKSYNYQGTLTLNKVGDHHFFCTYQTPEGDWNTNVDLGSGLADEDREEDIYVKEKEKASIVPETSDKINIEWDRSFEITDYQAQLKILENGDIQVNEIFEYDFDGDFNGIIRTIGIKGSDGLQYFKASEYFPIDKELNYDQSIKGDMVTYKIYDKSSNERKLFLLEYQLKSVITLYNDTAEFYWKFFDESNTSPIGHVKIEVELPGEVSKEELKVFGHGPLDREVSIQEDGKIVYEVYGLSSGEMVEARILFPTNLVPYSIKKFNENKFAEIMEEESGSIEALEEEITVMEAVEDKIEKEKLIIDSSLYHIECSKPIVSGNIFVVIPVNVSGPADELALILTNPKGETDIRFISKRALIDNFETVKLRMGDAPLSRGPYILTVKTVTPEKVIYKIELWFTSPDVSIADAEFTYKITHLGGAYGYAGYYFLEITSLTLINNGDLPAKRDTDARALITLDGKPENMTLLTRPYSISPYKIDFYPPFYIPNGKNKIPAHHLHAVDAMYGLKKGQYFVTITIPLMGGETVSFKKALTIE